MSEGWAGISRRCGTGNLVRLFGVRRDGGGGERRSLLGGGAVGGPHGADGAGEIHHVGHVSVPRRESDEGMAEREVTTVA